MPSHLTVLSVPDYRPDIRLTSFGGNRRGGHDSPKFISLHRVERLAEIRIGCQQPDAEITQTLIENTECQDATYGRLLGCETTQKTAGGAGEQLLPDSIEENSCQDLPGTERRVTPL